MSLFNRVTNIIRGKILDAQQQPEEDVDALLAAEMARRANPKLQKRSQKRASPQPDKVEPEKLPSQPKKRTL